MTAVVSGCLELPATEEPLPSATATAVPGQYIYTIYFTDPHSPTASSYRGGPDAYLAAAIDLAVVSVDVAIHDLNLWGVRDALLAAHQRGVSVRVVAESDNLDEQEFQDLIVGGIPVLGDRREGLMHNKFVIIDRLEVWTGSLNFTTTEGYLNDNNLVRVRSSRLAEDYTTEFEEMFVEDLFGETVRPETPYPHLDLDGIEIEVYFSPDDGTERRLLDLIQAAQDSIYFLAFSFTSDPLAQAVIERAQAGVDVAGVMEEAQYESNTGSEYEHFRSAGLDVRLDGNPYNMHHKVMIIDQQIVITGSYNFSASAENVNDENTLVFHSQPIVAAYFEEFERLFAEAQQE